MYLQLEYGTVQVKVPQKAGRLDLSYDGGAALAHNIDVLNGFQDFGVCAHNSSDTAVASPPLRSILMCLLPTSEYTARRVVVDSPAAAPAAACGLPARRSATCVGDTQRGSRSMVREERNGQ